MGELTDASREEFKALIREYGCATFEGELLAAAVECYLMELDGEDAGTEVGRSRVGGVPDLPVGVGWP